MAPKAVPRRRELADRGRPRERARRPLPRIVRASKRLDREPAGLNFDFVLPAEIKAGGLEPPPAHPSSGRLRPSHQRLVTVPSRTPRCRARFRRWSLLSRRASEASASAISEVQRVLL